MFYNKIVFISDDEFVILDSLIWGFVEISAFDGK